MIRRRRATFAPSCLTPAIRGWKAQPTDFIRRGIGAVFDKYDIETIAPGYGCISPAAMWWRGTTRCSTIF